jgi:hypothetical protein
MVALAIGLVKVIELLVNRLVKPKAAEDMTAVRLEQLSLAQTQIAEDLRAVSQNLAVSSEVLRQIQARWDVKLDRIESNTLRSSMGIQSGKNGGL